MSPSRTEYHKKNIIPKEKITINIIIIIIVRIIMKIMTIIIIIIIQTVIFSPRARGTTRSVQTRLQQI